MFQDNQRDVEMPLQALPRLQLATGSQEVIPIKPAVLGCVAFCNRGRDRRIAVILLLVRGVHKNDPGGLIRIVEGKTSH